MCDYRYTIHTLDIYVRRCRTGPVAIHPIQCITQKENIPCVLALCYHTTVLSNILGLWLRLECSLDSLSIDSAHVIYVSEGYDVAYNRRTASQPSYVVLRVTWYVKTFRNVNYVC